MHMYYQICSFDQFDNRSLYEMLAHRFEVFVIGQRAIYRDMDGFDEAAMHLLARDEQGALQGYVRLLPAQLHYDGYDENSFGRLSVKESARGQGIGSQLVGRACQWLTETSDCKAVRISAMAYLKDFYTRLGFRRVSDVFDKEGVPHVTMLYQAETAAH